MRRSRIPSFAKTSLAKEARRPKEMKKVRAQYAITRYGLTVGSLLQVTENSGGMRT